jgi:uncharacterized protein (DUF1499 family)
MTQTRADNVSATRPSMLAKIALYVALITIGAILVGALGATAGLLAPLTGFLLFAAAIVLGSILSLLLGAIALLVTRARPGRPARAGRRPAVVATAIGAALLALLAVLASRSGGVPAIHDVTTDPADPPSFVAAARAAGNQGRDLTYPHGRGDVTALQRAAYPDLEPIRLAIPPDQAMRRGRAAAAHLGWKEIEVDDGEGRLEATSTSRVFRFVDDIVVRVRPDGGGSIVDVRSTSRVGESDLGANAARIRAFRDRLAE